MTGVGRMRAVDEIQRLIRPCRRHQRGGGQGLFHERPLHPRIRLGGECISASRKQIQAASAAWPSRSGSGNQEPRLHEAANLLRGHIQALAQLRLLAEVGEPLHAGDPGRRVKPAMLTHRLGVDVDRSPIRSAVQPSSRSSSRSTCARSSALRTNPDMATPNQTTPRRCKRDLTGLLQIRGILTWLVIDLAGGFWTRIAQPDCVPI